MTPLRQHMIAALQLSGKSERTQQTYVREVRLLAPFYRKSPDLISEQELQHYVLHRKHINRLAPSSMRICSSALRFFYPHVLERDWKTLDLIRAESEHRLPAILSLEEVHRLLNAATPLHHRVSCTTVYSGGLRLHEALSLQVSDIDSPRHMVHVHRGKGAKDRYVPLPHATLALLRLYWQTHRNPTLLLPACGRDHTPMATAPAPMRRSSVQGAFRKAPQRAGIIKRDVGGHTLRQCYATQLLEAGVNLRAMQRYLGHAHLETTMLYLHLTQKGHEDAYQRIDALMRGFQA
jgi:integrase/recombinase XerD